ncbi:TetR/AcrR family transcriptional regulator [Amycolatopsis viridis]|uniref:AcrR family transcriptional regulator n=1 Tax=Amycolatopsis viridis TaxID=185678 RepID=A0ABX0T0N1_9PSEU|nr:TetR family transcriptional regulator [Amycolatopsis viridis]NIH82179.1 AcrR family transcriptional regulator [Amycolatopsis viridis]
MSPRPGKPRRSKGITEDAIITAAVELTRDKGLDDWSMRDLAKVLGVYPAVIHHHMGNRATVATAVVDRVLAEYQQLPEEDLPWQDWWRGFLTNLRAVFVQFPGTARHVATHGPSRAFADSIVDCAMRTLLAAGFERDEAAMVCRILVSQACLFTTLQDDQRRASKATDHRADAGVTDRPTSPEENPGYFRALFDYAIDRMLDGVEARRTATSGA